MKLFVEQAILGEGITFGEAALGIFTGINTSKSSVYKANVKVRNLRNARILALTDLQ
jgi:hypothetical protein